MNAISYGVPERVGWPPPEGSPLPDREKCTATGTALDIRAMCPLVGLGGGWGALESKKLLHSHGQVGATGTDFDFFNWTRRLTLGSDGLPLEELVAPKTVRAAVEYDRPATGVTAGGHTVFRAS